MHLSIPNEKQMFQSITYNSNNPMVDEGVFNSSFNANPTSTSNYHKRKQ